MKCPFCREGDLAVIDSRTQTGGFPIRRRRVCSHCKRRISTVEQIEVVTEFRRVVMFAEEQIRHGDHMFGLRQTEPAMRPWHGKLTIAARLRFHPMNTFRASPPYDITVGAPPIPRLDTRRTSLYALASSQKPATPTPLTGAIVEVDFDAQTVGQAVRQVRVVLEGKEVLRTMVDFATLQ